MKRIRLSFKPGFFFSSGNFHFFSFEFLFQSILKDQEGKQAIYTSRGAESTRGRFVYSLWQFITLQEAVLNIVDLCTERAYFNIYKDQSAKSQRADIGLSVRCPVVVGRRT